MVGFQVHRLRLAALAVLTGFGVAAAGAGAAGPVALHTSKQPTVIGKILVNGSGRTLYHYASDTKTVVKCIGPCTSKWPPLLIAAGVKPIAGPGVTASLIGNVKRPDGKLQITYRGKPLYLFTGDRKAGDVKGQGLSGIWHALAPSGSVVMKAAKAAAGTGSGSGSGSSTGSGSGSSTPSPTPSPSPSPTPPPGGGGTSVNCDANPAAAGCGM
jgi:predicted lipoprotein with Yx(FWY)xxD motif